MKGIRLAAGLWLLTHLSTVCWAVDITVEDLEQVLRENAESVFAVDAEFSARTSYTRDVDSWNRENDMLEARDMRVALERDRFFTDCAFTERPDGGRRDKVIREAWNGRERYRAWSNGDAGSSYNAKRSDFVVSGNVLGNMTHLSRTMGLNHAVILGTYSKESNNSHRSPLEAIDAARTFGGVVRLSDVVSSLGTKCLCLSYLFHDKLVCEHYVDPDFGYACVESNYYPFDGGGLHENVIRKFDRDQDGGIRPVSSVHRTTVECYAWRLARARADGIGDAEGFAGYDPADYGQIAAVTEVTISKYRANEPIDQSVYEPESVFFLGGQVWDEDRGIQITKSLKEIESETRRAIDRALDDLVASGPIGVSTPSAGGRIVETNDFHISGGAPPDGNAMVDASGSAKPHRSRGIWLVLLVIGIVGTGVAVVLRAKGILLTIAVSAVITTGDSPAWAARSGEAASEIVNMGVVPRLKDWVSCSYVLRNHGDKPMVIKKVTTSCSCVLPDPPAELGPHQEVSLPFRVSTAKHVGLFTQEVQIIVEPNDVRRIRINGYKQNASLTQQVVFPDIIVDSAAAEGGQACAGVMTLELFDRKEPNHIARDDFTYDGRRYCISEEAFRDDDYSVEIAGERWYYIRRPYSIAILPTGHSKGDIRDEIVFHYTPFDDTEHETTDERTSAREPNCYGTMDGRRFELVTKVMGRVLGDFYAKPASITFLVNMKKPIEANLKRFTLFKQDDVQYRLYYDPNLLCMTQVGDSFAVTPALGYCDNHPDRSEACPLQTSIRFVYGEPDEQLVVPVKLIFY